MGWRADAACVHVTREEQDYFFSEDDNELMMAQVICASCPVTAECLQYALETGQPAGVYGMHTEKDRRTLKRFITLRPREAQAQWDRSFEKIELRLNRRLAMNFEAP